MAVIFIGAFEWLLKAVKKAGIFKRNKVSVKCKVKACLMYMSGLSHRGMTVASSLISASHVAVYYWVQKLNDLVQNCFSKVRVRRALAVDETKLKVNGEQPLVWAAIDVDSREVLAVDASWQRSILNAEHVLKKALRLCRNKPLILVDRGPWYPDAMKSLELSSAHVTTGLRNRVERWFTTLKERTRRFYNNFALKKRGIKCVKLFLETFRYWYNNLRTHQTPKRPPSQTLS